MTVDRLYLQHIAEWCYCYYVTAPRVVWVSGLNREFPALENVNMRFSTRSGGSGSCPVPFYRGACS